MWLGIFHTINESHESRACVGSMGESDQQRRDIVAIKKHKKKKNKQNFNSTLLKYTFMYILQDEI